MDALYRSATGENSLGLFAAMLLRRPAPSIPTERGLPAIFFYPSYVLMEPV